MGWRGGGENYLNCQLKRTNTLIKITEMRKAEFSILIVELNLTEA